MENKNKIDKLNCVVSQNIDNSTSCTTCSSSSSSSSDQSRQPWAGGRKNNADGRSKVDLSHQVFKHDTHDTYLQGWAANRSAKGDDRHRNKDRRHSTAELQETQVRCVSVSWRRIVALIKGEKPRCAWFKYLRGKRSWSVYISEAKRESIKARLGKRGFFLASRLEKTFPPWGFDTIIFGAPWPAELW